CTPPRPPRSPLFPYTTLFRSVEFDRKAGPLCASSRSGRECGSRGGSLSVLGGPGLEQLDRLLEALELGGAVPGESHAVEATGGQIGRAHVELQSLAYLVCRLL